MDGFGILRLPGIENHPVEIAISNLTLEALNDLTILITCDLTTSPQLAHVGKSTISESNFATRLKQALKKAGLSCEPHVSIRAQYALAVLMKGCASSYLPALAASSASSARAALSRLCMA